MDKLWKIWKETAFIELCSFFIDLLAFELGKLCPGVGILVSFFSTPGARVLHWKAVPGVGISTKKLVAQGGWYPVKYLHYSIEFAGGFISLQ